MAPSATSAATGPPLVAGLLIGDVTPLAPGASPLVRLASSSLAAAPAARRAIGARLGPALAAALAVALLLGLGAARELRGRRKWPAASVRS